MSMLPLFNGPLAPVEKRRVNGEWQVVKRTPETITVIARIPKHPWDEKFACDIVTAINEHKQPENVAPLPYSAPGDPPPRIRSGSG